MLKWEPLWFSTTLLEESTPLHRQASDVKRALLGKKCTVFHKRLKVLSKGLERRLNIKED